MKQNPVKRKRRVRDNKPKSCRFCACKAAFIDFKDAELLRKFQTEKGRIISRRLSGNCLDHQKMLAIAIKRARIAGLVL